VPTYLYFLCDPRDGGIRYVGITNDPKRRYKFHCKSFQRRRLYRYQWIRSLRRAGVAPRMVVQYQFSTRDRARIAEIRMIAALRSRGVRLVNMTCGGE
jgi:predicted GIY-YIG superfamily endonuclease